MSEFLPDYMMLRITGIYQEEELMNAMPQSAIVECSKCRHFSSKFLGAAVTSVADAIKNKRCGHCQCGDVKVHEISESGDDRCPLSLL